MENHHKRNMSREDLQNNMVLIRATVCVKSVGLITTFFNDIVSHNERTCSHWRRSDMLVQVSACTQTCTLESTARAIVRPGTRVGFKQGLCSVRGRCAEWNIVSNVPYTWNHMRQERGVHDSIFATCVFFDNGHSCKSITRAIDPPKAKNKRFYASRGAISFILHKLVNLDGVCIFEWFQVTPCHNRSLLPHFKLCMAEKLCFLLSYQLYDRECLCMELCV